MRKIKGKSIDTLSEGDKAALNSLFRKGRKFNCATYVIDTDTQDLLSVGSGKIKQ
jgi:hypothetical protein